MLDNTCERRTHPGSLTRCLSPPPRNRQEAKVGGAQSLRGSADSCLRAEFPPRHPTVPWPATIGGPYPLRDCSLEEGPSCGPKHLRGICSTTANYSSLGDTELPSERLLDPAAWEGLDEVVFQIGPRGCAEFWQVTTGIDLLWI